MDRQHPLYTPELAAKHGDFLPWLYEQMDAIIGRMLQRVDEHTTFMVMSDHGFGTFRKQFNLNSWLMDYGYATPTRNASRGSEALFADVNWATTRAYGLGINGLYLNLQGRERDGTVRPGSEAGQLTDELIRHLTGIRDPDTGTAVISRVCRARDIYSGPHTGNAPDLVVCYAPGYRASWDTVLGKYPREHILDNLDPWSGDHSMDSSHLQGVLLSNRPISTTKPALEDIAPTLLSLFGVPRNPAMTGRNLMDDASSDRKQAKETPHV
jgi:predicted AlkP superfamily phosphohydrolase/phosphomutase